jgi:hypothetical protein
VVLFLGELTTGVALVCSPLFPPDAARASSMSLLCSSVGLKNNSIETDYLQDALSLKLNPFARTKRPGSGLSMKLVKTILNHVSLPANGLEYLQIGISMPFKRVTCT